MTRRRRPRSGGYYGGPASSGNAGAAGTAAAPYAQTSANNPPDPNGPGRWYKMDLHTHTPASSDYEEPRISWLDWLRMAAERSLDIVAITDHNTVAGVSAIRREIEWLTRLEQQNRLNDDERAALAAWRELSNKVLVLPGFEFTATFGFHILGIFPPATSVRTLEHILLTLKVPPDKVDVGSTETGSTTDVLTAYRVIREAGGLAIAAHANSTHGVAMRNFPFGGQTKIAYTQDANLDALEVTDLEHRGFSTARFFDGSKTEYPRHMHSLQGSDAHRLTMDPRNPKRLGIGERATEVFLEDCTFEALATLLRSTAWGHTRAARPKEKPFDALAAARAAGNTAVQSFHEAATKAGGKIDAILADICAFANTAGGALYVGVSLRPDGPVGLTRPNQVEEQILAAVGERIAPSLVVRTEIVKSDNASVLRLQIPKGDDRPHALDGTQIWMRDEARTRAANRDEIVAMVLEVMEQRSAPLDDEVAVQFATQTVAAPPAPPAPTAPPPNGVAPDEGAAKPKAHRSRRGGRPGAGKAALPADAQATQDADDDSVSVADTVEHAENAVRAGQPITGEIAPQVEPPVVDAVTGAPAAEAPKPRTKRTRSAKTAAAAATAATAAAAIADPANAPAQPEAHGEAPAAAPKSSRRRSTTASATASAAAAGEAAPAPAPTDAEAAPPTKPTRSAKSPRSAAAPTKAPAAASAPAAPAAADQLAPKPTPGKRAAKAKPATAAGAPDQPAQAQSAPSQPAGSTILPQIGVEIVASEQRDGVWQHSIRDLRNGSVIKSVTRRGARDLWNYAIRAAEEKRFDPADAEWLGDVGLLHVEKRAGKMRYDLALRSAEGVRIFYGVTADSMPGPWGAFVVDEE